MGAVSLAAKSMRRNRKAVLPFRRNRIKSRRLTVNVIPWVLLLLSLTVGCLFYVQARTNVIFERYQLMDAQRNQDQIRRENRTLRLKWTTLTSPVQLEDIARKRFQLHYPKPNEVVKLR